MTVMNVRAAARLGITRPVALSAGQVDETQRAILAAAPRNTGTQASRLAGQQRFNRRAAVQRAARATRRARAARRRARGR